MARMGTVTKDWRYTDTDAQFELQRSLASEAFNTMQLRGCWWRIDQSTAAVIVIAGAVPNEGIIEKGED